MCLVDIIKKVKDNLQNGRKYLQILCFIMGFKNGHSSTIKIQVFNNISKKCIRIWRESSPKKIYKWPITHEKLLMNISSGSVQFSRSVVSDSLRPHEWQQASLFITNSRSLLKLTSIELVLPSSHLILCGPLLLLPPIPPSIRVFSNESTLHMRWPKYWSFSFSIISSKH